LGGAKRFISIRTMRTHALLSLVALVSAGIVSPLASAVDVGCPSVSLWNALPRSLPLNPWDVDGLGVPLPALGQGQNGITCEYRNTTNGQVTPLVWLNYANQYQCWGAPRIPFNVPQIYAMQTGKRVWAHPNVNLEAVIRVRLEGNAGIARVIGSTSTDASQSITFTIYQNDFEHPVWSGGPFESFNLSILFSPDDDLLFVTNAGPDATQDWAWWGNTEIYADKAIELTGDGHVDAADLGTLLGAWGACDGCAADLNCDGQVDAADLSILLGAWTG
jgi:hypothetical protein